MKKVLLIIILNLITLVSFFVFGDLIISEVYFAGTDEWIEIYNNSVSSFSGNLTISGAKSTNINLNNILIPGNDFVLFGDNITDVIDLSKVVETGLVLNISDTQDLNVKLIVSGSVIDSIYTDSGFIAVLKNKTESLQKIISGGVFLTTGSDYIFNISGGKIANPGDIFSYIPIINTGNNNNDFWGKLIISEVYFQSSDERIEIFNPTSEVFTGSFTISGAGTQNFNFSNVNINPGQFAIFGENLVSMIDPGGLFWTGIGFFIDDSSSLNIQILSSGSLIDEISGNQNTVTNLGNQKASIQKVISGNFYITTGGNITEPQNVFPGYLANPLNIYYINDVLTGGQNTGNVNQSGNLGLYITEVFFDGYDERIEITNFSNEVFSGDLTIVGAGNSHINMQNTSIGSGKSIIIAQNDSYFLDKSYVAYSGISITLQDNGSIALSLMYSGNVIDTFLAQSEYVNLLNDQTTSFEKVNCNGTLVTTICTGSRIFNIISGYIANPGMIFSVGNNVIDVTQTGTSLTGSNSTGLNFTGNLNCSGINSILKVTEIFPGSGSYGSFIELKFESDYSGQIVFSGNSLVQGFTIDINIEKGHRTIVSSTANGWLSTQEKIIEPSLSINLSGGSLILFGQSGQVLDNLFIGELQKGMSIYFTTNTGCVNHLQTMNLWSPGYDESFNFYITGNVQIVEKIVEVEKIIYVNNGGGEGSCNCQICGTGNNNGSSGNILATGNITNTGLVNSGNLFNSGIVNSGNMVSSGNIKIIGIDFFYDADEKIQSVSLKSNLNYNLNMKNYRFALSGRLTKNLVNGILFSGQTSIFTGRFYYPYSGGCVKLYSGNEIIDEYCYDNNIIYTGNVINQDSGSLTTGYQQEEDNYSIKIKSIVYDPPGTDAGNESITLVLSGVDQVDLEDFRLIINNKTTKRIYGILNDIGEQTFVGTFGFLNAGACVSLTKNGVIFDNYCYQSTPVVENTGSIESVNYGNYELKILDVNYDPVGGDIGKESISLNLKKGSDIDLADGFYLEWNGRKKYLKNYGSLKLGEVKQLLGTFGFPNTKDTCIELGKEDWIFDKYCYYVNSGSDNTIETGEDVVEQNINLRITFILPNPVGKDNKEQIGIKLLAQQMVTGLDLNDGYYLLIGGIKKKYISGVIKNNGEKILIDNFAFPNKSSCVSIGRNDKIFDTMCYSNPKEGEKFLENNKKLQELSTLDLSILNKVKLKKSGDQVCAIYSGQNIACNKYSFKVGASDELKLYKNYIQTFHEYLQSNWSILYFNSRIKQYVGLLDEAKDKLKSGYQNVVIDNLTIKIYDIGTWFDKKYSNSFSEKVEKYLGQSLFDQKGLNNFISSEKKYFENISNQL